MTDFEDLSDTPQMTSAASKSEHDIDAPEQIDEFRIKGLLGRGGFGTVYLAHDTILHRDVAIKIPRLSQASAASLAEQYLNEARTIAGLDHPNIIPVYRAARTDEVACYIVTKYIQGTHLGQWTRRNTPRRGVIAQVVSTIASSLAYAHQHGLVHRDIKPNNILIGENGQPYVADFGLALRDWDLDAGPAYAGTPAYMSPEQARGEGHRVDGRSDIFSLGVVLYTMLTGTRPFAGANRNELFHNIQFTEPLKPRSIDASIPKELESICLRAMAKSITARYQQADDMAAELDGFVLAYSHDSFQTTKLDGDVSEDTDFSLENDATVATSIHEKTTSPVVPKGLRPFESRDADFFLQLLPGPQDRQGLPEAIRFWKSRIEAKSSEKPFSVGVLYGPSGCGKTSLVRAGLMPVLDSSVTPLYLEATPTETEKSLAAILTSSTGAPENLDLPKTVAWLRRNSNQKVVLFIDQFEQWLFAHADLDREPLTNALRQCDGDVVQCVLMVRDDFWMGISRFMRALELPISENDNASAVDLFDLRHARNVLIKFGRAFGQLPYDDNQLSTEHDRFLDAAVNYLESGGRVVCVHLALLAEMMKNREWDEASLFDKEGASGLGVRFLDDLFDSDTASRRHRIHSQGTQNILRHLLPQAFSRIKGTVCSEQELFEASGYSERLAFNELVRILDSELHLITPADQGDVESMDSASSGTMETGYQLTHDFLIAPIREWLELRQLGTRLGQSMSRLQQFAKLYESLPRAQSLPSMFEFFSIRRRIAPPRWTAQQRRMMQAAFKLHAQHILVGLFIALMVTASSGIIWTAVSRSQRNALAQASVARLTDAQFSDALSLSSTLDLQDDAIRGALLEIIGNSSHVQSKRVRAALAVAESHPPARDLITAMIANADPAQVVALGAAIAKGRNLVNPARVAEAWTTSNDHAELIRYAAILMHDTQGRALLIAERGRLTRALLQENPVHLSQWCIGFAAIGPDLVEPLSAAYSSKDASSTSRLNAANLLAKFATGQPEKLVDLVELSSGANLSVLTEALQQEQASGIDALNARIRSRQSDNPQAIDESYLTWLGVDRNRTLPEFNAELKERLDRSQSVVHELFIISHDLDADCLAELNGELSQLEYRLNSIVPYIANDRHHFMALWHRRSGHAAYTLSSTADEVRELNRHHLDTGFMPVDVVAYQRMNSEERVFCCVWVEGPPLPFVLDSDLYADVTDDRHQVDGWEPFNQRGLVPQCQSIVYAPGDQRRFTSIRWRLSQDVLYKDNWEAGRDEVARLVETCRDAVLVEARCTYGAALSSSDSMVSVWWNGLPIDSELASHRAPLDHIRECKLKAAEGYWPQSISVGSSSRADAAQFGSCWWRPRISQRSESERMLRLSRLLLCAFQLGNTDWVKQSLASTENPEIRSQVISAFPECQPHTQWLVQTLVDTDDMVLKRACAKALAGYHVDLVDPDDLKYVAAYVDILKSTIASHGSVDAGLVSAVELLCRRWGLNGAEGLHPEDLQQYETSQGQRMIRVDPPEIVPIGSLAGELGRDLHKESLIKVRLQRSFAISDTEVTIEQFLKFRPDFEFPKDYAASKDCPALSLEWIDAASYCHWLSKQEGIAEAEMCYPNIDKLEGDLRLPANCLQRVGYRLPTATEMEFASRGGYPQTRYCGHSPELLDAHAWTARNSDYKSHPVAGLLPNDYGLFDMLGNVMEWCHDDTIRNRNWLTADAIEDPGQNELLIRGTDTRASLGGAQLYQPLDARASQQDRHRVSGFRYPYLGFRIARTIQIRAPLQNQDP